MPDSSKPDGKVLTESAVTDLFENGRHPAESEKQWAEKTLAPSLEKGPEKPIGAPTGVDVDEHGHARYTTISGMPIRRLYTPADLPADWKYEDYLNYPGQPPYTRGIHASGYRGSSTFHPPSAGAGSWVRMLDGGESLPRELCRLEYAKARKRNPNQPRNIG
jgi:Methylmalonyl-CoA mutase